MRNICSLFFYELLNVIKVTNQILGESISSRVKVGCSKVKKVCWLCCNSWQSWTGESHVSTFSFHRTLRQWASFCNDQGELMRGGLQHEDTSQAGWTHCQGQGVGPRVSRWSVESKMMAPSTRDCVNMTGAFQQHWGMTMDTLIAHVLRRGNWGWNKSFWATLLELYLKPRSQ